MPFEKEIISNRAVLLLTAQLRQPQSRPAQIERDIGGKMDKKRYPAPVGGGFSILGMMCFKENVVLSVEVVEVWKYDVPSQGFYNIELPWTSSIEASMFEFFPVYQIDSTTIVIFMWREENDFGIFIEIKKELVGRIITTIPFPISVN